MKQSIKIIVLMLLSLYLASCERPSLEGPTVTEDYVFSTIDKVVVDGICQANINYGIHQKIALTGPQDKMENVTIYIDGTTLFIETQIGVYTSAEITANITLSNIEAVTAIDDGRIWLDGFSNLGDLSLSLSRYGLIRTGHLNLGQNQLSIELASSGNIEVNGFAESCEINISESGNFKGFGLYSNTSTVNISGSGNAEITVNNDLKVDLLGSGNLSYKGYPTINSNITGTGEIINAN